MPDDDVGFRFEFTLPDEAMTPEGAAEWLSDFADRLSKEDKLRVSIEGRYRTQLTDPKAPVGQQDHGDGAGVAGHGKLEHVPVVSIMVCPGKRPYAPPRKKKKKKKK